MKLHLSILTGVASVAAIMSNVFADTAVTDPVGYVTIQVRAPGSLSFVAPSLVNKTEFAGKVVSHGANTITVDGTPFTANAFDTDPVPAVGPQYYVEITNGTGTEGLWTNITTNANNQITTEDDLSASIVDNTTTIKIRKHVSIADVFGATNSAGLFGSDQVSTADEIKILDTQTKNVVSVFYYDDGIDEAWVNADFDLVANLGIQPGQGLFIERKAPGAFSFVNVGHVKTGPTMMTFDEGLSVIGVPHAVGANFVLDLTNLTEIPQPVVPGPQSGRVVGSDQIATADVLKVAQLDGTLKECFYYNDGIDAAWVDADFNLIGPTEQLKEGTSFVFVRQAGAGTFTWTSPLEVIAP